MFKERLLYQDTFTFSFIRSAGTEISLRRLSILIPNDSGKIFQMIMRKKYPLNLQKSKIVQKLKILKKFCHILPIGIPFYILPRFGQKKIIIIQNKVYPVKNKILQEELYEKFNESKVNYFFIDYCIRDDFCLQ